MIPPTWKTSYINTYLCEWHLHRARSPTRLYQRAVTWGCKGEHGRIKSPQKKADSYVPYGVTGTCVLHTASWRWGLNRNHSPVNSRRSAASFVCAVRALQRIREGLGSYLIETEAGPRCLGKGRITCFHFGSALFWRAVACGHSLKRRQHLTVFYGGDLWLSSRQMLQ